MGARRAGSPPVGPNFIQNNFDQLFIIFWKPTCGDFLMMIVFCTIFSLRILQHTIDLYQTIKKTSFLFLLYLGNNLGPSKHSKLINAIQYKVIAVDILVTQKPINFILIIQIEI